MPAGDAAAVLLGQAERLANRWIDESSPAARAAAGLEGCSMRIDIVGTGLAPRLEIRDGQAALSLDESLPADVLLKATPGDLARLGGEDSIEQLRASRAELTGDVKVAERFAELFRRARPDPEHELSQWIGDLAAHEAAELARAVAGFARRAGRALEADTAEYLQEEQRLLPAPTELAAFVDDVERLRDAVDRAEARIERLAAARATR